VHVYGEKEALPRNEKIEKYVKHAFSITPEKFYKRILSAPKSWKGYLKDYVHTKRQSMKGPPS